LKSGLRFCANAHLSDDDAVAKMGHPIRGALYFVEVDVGHPSISRRDAWGEGALQGFEERVALFARMFTLVTMKPS